MIRKIIMMVLIGLLCVSTAISYEVSKTYLPDTLKAGDTDLRIKGAGLRKVFGFKVYAGGLYLNKPLDNGIRIINSDEPMAIRLQWRRSAPPHKIKEVYFKSFAKVVGAPKSKVYTKDTDYGVMGDAIRTYMDWISNKHVQKGHYWNNIYIPGVGTQVYTNDGTGEKFLGTIEGLEFKKILFSIWLGHESARSVSERLKNDMLGLEEGGASKKPTQEVKDVSLDELDNI